MRAARPAANNADAASRRRCRLPPIRAVHPVPARLREADRLDPPTVRPGGRAAASLHSLNLRKAKNGKWLNRSTHAFVNVLRTGSFFVCSYRQARFKPPIRSIADPVYVRRALPAFSRVGIKAELRTLYSFRATSTSRRRSTANPYCTIPKAPALQHMRQSRTPSLRDGCSTRLRRAVGEEP